MSARRKPAPDAVEVAAFGAFDQVRARLDELRTEVGRLRGELEHELHRPVPMAEVERRVDAALDELRRGMLGRLNAGALTSAGGDRVADTLAGLRATPMELAAAVAPDRLRAWLLAQATETLARLPEPADAETRHERLAGLRAELLAVERREAALLWAGEEQGVELEWRGDLDPRAVLGLED